MNVRSRIFAARVAILIVPHLPHWACVHLARLLHRVMMRHVVSGRPPDFQVTRDSDRDVYLRRWWVIPRNEDFNIYLHNMLRDDDPIMHDHMYRSWSLCLGGQLHERYQERPPSGPVLERTIRLGGVTIRSEHVAHQLIVDWEAWTIFITGPRVKEWGFWCPRGFRHWRDYVALTQDPSVRGNGVGNTSGRGVGCGEMS